MTGLDAALQKIVEEAVVPLHVKLDRLEKLLVAQQPPPPQADTVGSDWVCEKLNKSQAALHMFLRRTPSFPCKKIGRRLVFSRAAVEAWIEAQGAKKRRGGAT